MTTERTCLDKQWVILELSRMGERERPEDLFQILKREAGSDDLDIFVPSVSFSRRDNWVTICLMEGYAFIEGGRPAGFYFDLEDSPYVSKVLTRNESNGRFLVYVSHDEILKLKERLRDQTIRDLKEGDTVEVTSGAYSSLEGTVIDFTQDNTHALIKIHDLVSLDTIVELPLQFLQKI
jgi:transcription antitermination factor NusG